MTDIEIKNGKATSKERVDFGKWMAIKRQFEGRTSFGKTGEVSFVSSPYNIDVWRRTFPNSNVFDVDAEMEALREFIVNDRPQFVFKRQPLWWQENATKKQQALYDDKSAYNAFAFFYSPGGGKSKSLADFSAALYCKGLIDAAIIIVPNILVGDQWVSEDDETPGALKKDIDSSIQYRSWLWRKTKAARYEYEAMKESNGLQFVVMNIDAMKTPSGSELLNDFIERHKGRVLFALDEAHMAGNPARQRHKAALELRSKCQWAAALTGTPITKNLISLYAIFKLLDPRILGYKFVGSFKNEYCITKWNGFADQIVGHKNIEKLYERIDKYTSRVSQEEMGLEKIRDEFIFDMSDEQRKHFDRLKKEWLTALDNGEFASASIALTATLKMQQVSCGFLIGDDGQVQLLDNARLRALDAYLETLPEDEKVMVWCRFLEDAKLLTKHFGDKAVDLSGNVTSKERVDNKNRFLKEPGLLRCIATPDAAGTGLDSLQHVTNRAIYYSSSENYVNRVQSEDRVLRVGGGNVAYIVDLVCRKSPDMKILKNLRGKHELSTMTLDEIRKIFE